MGAHLVQPESADSRMGVGAPEDRGVEATRRLQIVHETAPTYEQARILPTLHPGADLPGAHPSARRRDHVREVLDEALEVAVVDRVHPQRSRRGHVLQLVVGEYRLRWRAA